MLAPARRWLLGLGAALLLGVASGCAGESPTTGEQPPDTASARIPLSDMGPRSYMGFVGGLYLSGSNSPPQPHADAGQELGRAVQPLDVRGNPSPTGRYVLLSIGMSNTTQEFSTFQQLAAADPAVDREALVIVDGALGGRTAEAWASRGEAEFDRIRDTKLAPLGLSEHQVQVAWLKVANSNPSHGLPSVDADAYRLVGQMGTIARALRARYPNLRQVFVSSRIYAGYANTALNPEPYAYESGFAVKWLIQAQIDQARGLAPNSRAGDLRYPGTAPWLAWGPYLWANGTQPRSDGLVWERVDLAQDGTHPSAAGRTKVAELLLDFFKRSPFTRCWFVRGGTCG